MEDDSTMTTTATNHDDGGFRSTDGGGTRGGRRWGGENGRTYDMEGHGVPVGLLRHLCDAAGSWLGLSTTTTTRRRKRHRNLEGFRRRYDEISFASAPHSTSLDAERIGIVVPAMTTTTTTTTACASYSRLLLPSLPAEWEEDLEMYMVVMDRIGSRMATLAMTAAVVVVNDDKDDDDDIDARRTVGSIVVPSRLRKWDVTVVRGGDGEEARSPSCIVRGGDDGRDWSDDGGDDGDVAGACATPPTMPTLSLEWARTTEECWKVVLRLHNRSGLVVDVVAMEEEEGHDNGRPWRDSVSLVFEGEYVPP
jgi:hypothetical protein